MRPKDPTGELILLVTLDVLIRQAVVSLVVTNVGPAIDGWLIAGCCCLRL